MLSEEGEEEMRIRVVITDHVQQGGSKLSLASNKDFQEISVSRLVFIASCRFPAVSPLHIRQRKICQDLFEERLKITLI